MSQQCKHDTQAAGVCTCTSVVHDLHSLVMCCLCLESVQSVPRHATLMNHMQASLHSDYEAAGLLRPGSGVDEVLARASRQLPSPQLVSPRPARRITGASPCRCNSVPATRVGLFCIICLLTRIATVDRIRAANSCFYDLQCEVAEACIVTHSTHRNSLYGC